MIRKIVNNMGMGLFFLGIAVLLFLMIYSVYRMIDIPPQKFSLKQMQIGSAMRGSFILGCGSIGQETYYYCYVYNHDGSLVLLRKPVYRCKIYEDVNNIGDSYVIASMPGRSCAPDKLHQFSDVRSFGDYSSQWEFHILVNSIYQNIDINLDSLK